MVSVDPIMVEAISPMVLSTPHCEMMSVATAIEALPEMGLNMASGMISAGIFSMVRSGDRIFTIKSMRPDARNALMAKKIPIRVGKMLYTICNPS